MVQKLLVHSKGIILISILAFVVSVITTHRFDPTHPHIVTSDCIQAAVTAVQKTGWLVLLAVLAMGLGWRRHDLEDATRVFAFTRYIKECLVVLLLYDPLRRALREGRLRRLIYS